VLAAGEGEEAVGEQVLDALQAVLFGGLGADAELAWSGVHGPLPAVEGHGGLVAVVLDVLDLGRGAAGVVTGAVVKAHGRGAHLGGVPAQPGEVGGGAAGGDGGLGGWHAALRSLALVPAVRRRGG
jgi:hypothetical protein